MGIHNQYTAEMFDRFGYLATWAPGVPVALGDVGTLRDDVFVRVASLQDFGISFSTRADDTPDDIDYSSANGVSVTFKAAGATPGTGSSLGAADAGFEIAFSSNRAVVFQALGCRTPSIADQEALGKALVSRFLEKTWDRSYVVVTELMVADCATIIISDGANGRIDLKAQAKITAATAPLADASAALQVSYSHNINTKIIAKNGLTPLFRAKRVKSHVFRKPTFGIRADPLDAYTPDLVGVDEKDRELMKRQLYLGDVGPGGR